MKAATLESKFPILSVEHDCIISKDADITVCYRVELPELFTVTQAEYEAIHSMSSTSASLPSEYTGTYSRAQARRAMHPVLHGTSSAKPSYREYMTCPKKI